MNLQKIRNASLQELRVRAAQRVAAFRERRGWSTLARLPSDGTLRSLLNIGNVDFVEYFRIRTEPRFFADLREAAAAFKSRWPDSAQRVIEQADRICEGKFDLLGFTDLDFGNPIDWQFEPISGKRIPLLHWSKLDYLDAGIAGDKKIVWELNRHQYFIKLGQAYLLTGNERYARVFANHLDSWMDANPPKLGINWASSLEVAFRSISWLWALYFFKEGLHPETMKRALKFLYLSARHLESYLSTYFSPNTHLTGEALGLFYLGTLLPEFHEATRWQELGESILTEHVHVHVKPDGVYFEQSSYYHRYTTDFYLHFFILSRANGITLPKTIGDALTSLLDHLMHITRPDGTTPFFGDDDGGRLLMLDARACNDFRASLASGAALFSRGDYKFVAGDAAEELLWLLGSEGLKTYDAIAAREPEQASRAFPDGGYFVMRDGWTSDSNYLLFDCGPHGSLNNGHAHADALAFDLAANGRTTLVDPGTYTYTGSKEFRDWFRSSHAHNTVSLDGESSSVPNGAFSWRTSARCSFRTWIAEDRYDFVSGEHDGFMRLPNPATVTREILFLKGDYWIIRDALGSSTEHRAQVSFHFDSSTGSESNLDIRCFGDGEWVTEEGFVSHCYGQREPAKFISFAANLAVGKDVITFLLPQAPEVGWKVTEMEAPDGRAFEVVGEKSQDLVMIRAGEWVWKRFVDGQLKEIVSPQTQTDVRD